MRTKLQILKEQASFKRTPIKILYEGKFVRLVDENSWEYVQRVNATGIVIILAMNQKKEVILTEQYRVPVGRHVIEFPAGLVNDLELRKKETLKAAAFRELLEETGYEAKKMTHVLTGPVNTGLSGDTVTFFQAGGKLVKRHEGGGDDTESILVHEVPMKRIGAWLRRMEKRGKLIDPKVYAGLYFLNTRS